MQFFNLISLVARAATAAYTILATAIMAYFLVKEARRVARTA